VQKCFLLILAKGNYPMLKIVDVRNDAMSVATLWENFQINNINEELKKQLNSDEKAYQNLQTLTFQQASDLQKKLKMYDWNFGYLTQSRQINPRKIVITVQNIGGTDLNWQFKMPIDNQVSSPLLYSSDRAGALGRPRSALRGGGL